MGGVGRYSRAGLVRRGVVNVGSTRWVAVDPARPEGRIVAEVLPSWREGATKKAIVDFSGARVAKTDLMQCRSKNASRCSTPTGRP
jgi:hypothetical protein